MDIATRRQAFSGVSVSSQLLRGHTVVCKEHHRSSDILFTKACEVIGMNKRKNKEKKECRREGRNDRKRNLEIDTEKGEKEGRMEGRKGGKRRER